MTILGVAVTVGIIGIGLTAAKRSYGVLNEVVNGVFDVVDDSVGKIFKRS